MNYSQIFIVISSLIALISPIIYSLSILKGESKPHRTTRFVLLVITSLTTISLYAQGNTTAIWLAAVSTLQSIIIFSLSIKYGMGGWAKSDLACLAIALIGIILWQTTQDARIGLFAALIADFTGMVPALIKTYKFPETETWIFYIMDTFAGLFSLLAIPNLNIDQWIYPVYILLINLVMVVFIKRPKNKV
jgi:hypothetical protein